MTHKIAIVQTRDIYTNYGDDYERIIHCITDWEEVTDEEFADLKLAGPYFEFTVLEQPIDTRSFIDLTISKYKIIAKEQAERLDAEKKKSTAVALERKHKKELKDKASKLKMFQKLKEELGDEAP